MVRVRVMGPTGDRDGHNRGCRHGNGETNDPRRKSAHGPTIAPRPTEGNGRSVAEEG